MVGANLRSTVERRASLATVCLMLIANEPMFTLQVCLQYDYVDPYQLILSKDINGDKRTDVCCVDDNGDFQCWLNLIGKSGNLPQYLNWQPTGYLKKNTGFTGDQVSHIKYCI